MTAVAPPHLSTFPPKPNLKDISDYVSDQFNQSSAHSTRHAGSSSLGQDTAVQDIDHEKRRFDLYPDRESSRILVKSKSDIEHNSQGKNSNDGSNNGQIVNAIRTRRQLQRANTDRGPRRQSPSTARGNPEENWELRHGWEDQYNSSEYLGLLSSVSGILYFLFKRQGFLWIELSDLATGFLYVLYR